MSFQKYTLELLLNNGTPIPTVVHNTKTYLEGRKNTEYSLRFRNNTINNVLVILSVDGLDVINGKPAGTHSNGYVVHARETIVVPGWKINSDKAAKFKFLPQGDSIDRTYVESLRSEGFDVDTKNQGVIGFMVFREKDKPTYRGIQISTQNVNLNNSMDWMDNEQARGIAPNPTAMYKSYSSNSSQLLGSSYTPDWHSEKTESLGTGFGKESDFRTKSVSFVRENEFTPNFTGTLYYDTMRGLELRGVPTHSLKLMNSEPNPFPASPSVTGCHVPKNYR